MGNRVSQGSAVGRVAVITGGASGIGLGLAEQCARLKMKVCIADLGRQAELMPGIETRLRELGAQDVMFHATDVSKLEAVQALHDAVYAKWGDVGFLCNNAGVQVGKPGWDGSWDLSAETLENWRLTVDVDLFGVLHGHQVFVPTMLKQGREAVIVNTSSAAGLANTAYTPNGTTDMAYTVVKNGVTMITESLSAAMRSRGAPISCHVLCPYGTQSNLGLNSVKFDQTFDSEEQRQKSVEFMERLRDSTPEKMGVPGQITVQRNAEILQECIEVGRFYCVTPDRTATTNVSRTWMLSRAEDFINDDPPFTSAPGTKPFRNLRKGVEARARAPNHKWEGPSNAPSPYAGRRTGDTPKSKL